MSTNHPAGFTANVVTTASNKGVLLAFVAMAQTLVVLTAGIDLSVGMIFMLTNCLASWLVVGSPLETAFGVVAVLAAGLACGAINGLIVIYGRLQPIVTTIATGAIYFGIALLLRPLPGGEVNEDLADALTGKLFDRVPASLVVLAAVVLVVWMPFRRSLTGRAAYAAGSSEVAAYMSGVPIRKARSSWPTALAGLLAGDRRAVPHLLHLFGRGLGRQRQHLHALFDRRRGAGRRVAVRRRGSAVGAIFGALAFRTIGDLLFVFDLDPLWQPLFQGVVLLLAVSLGALRLSAGPQPARLVRMRRWRPTRPSRQPGR